MRKLPFIAAVIGATLVAACEPMPVEETLPEAQDACRASAYQGLIGQPREVLNSMTFPIGTRQIGPDQAVTSDLRPDRLNIEYGTSGRIEKVSCY